MPEIIRIGPFALHFHIIILIVSMLIGLFAIRFRLRAAGYDSKALFDLMLTGLLIIVLFWKFGALLFTPSILWKKPLQVLLMTGSWLEIALGSLAALLYIGYKLRRQNLSFIRFLDAIPYGILIAVSLSSIVIWEYGRETELPWGISLSDLTIHYHPVHAYTLIVSLLLLLWLWLRPYKLGESKALQDFLIYYGLALWVVSLFKAADQYALLLSPEQWLYSAMLVSGLLLQYVIKALKRVKSSR